MAWGDDRVASSARWPEGAAGASTGGETLPRRWRLLGEESRRPQRPAYDRILLTATLLLVGAGIVMVYSASAIRAQERFGDPYLFLKKQAVWAVVGLLAMSVAMRRDYRDLQRVIPILVLLSLLLLLLVLVPGVGVKVNGARRWLRVGGISFQPSELAKLSLILFLASYYARRAERLSSFVDGILPPLLVTGAFAGLVVAQPNFGMAVVLLLVAGTMSFAGGVRLRHLVATAACALPPLLLAMLASPHARIRLLALVDPGRVSPKAAYQLTQSFFAIGPGGLLGRGLGDSIQKLFYLPEPHTDFIFAIVGEEVGFIGSALVVLLFALILWRGTRAAVKAPDAFGGHLAMGIAFAIVGQAILNMAVVLGLLPTTGVPLPFLSFGGSSLVLTLVAVGILLNVSQRAGEGGA